MNLKRRCGNDCFFLSQTPSILIRWFLFISNLYQLIDSFFFPSRFIYRRIKILIISIVLIQDFHSEMIICSSIAFIIHSDIYRVSQKDRVGDNEKCFNLFFSFIHLEKHSHLIIA